MSVFTESELEYLDSAEFRGGTGARRLARIATVGKDGTPTSSRSATAMTAPAIRSTSPGATSSGARSTATSPAAAGPRSSSTTSPAPIPGGRAASRCAGGRR